MIIIIALTVRNKTERFENDDDNDNDIGNDADTH
jgi:hypothetical protein